jgi:2-desacetyl-2-hydroxyethyl bacteriochlorophyllide A dehydrogenase
MTIAARRVVFPAIKQAQWETLSLPDELRPREVRVKTARTLVSAGTEIAIYSGTHIGYSTPGARYPRLPFYPGYAYAGTVEAVGSEVTAHKLYKPGDRVVGSMGHQDRAVVEADGDRLDPIPDGVSFEQACLARLSAISLQGVRLARLAMGEHVAVFGQGLIGQLARQFAAIDGAATTTGVDLIDTRLEVARRHGATHVVNPAREDLSALLASVTDGRGADACIEATGNPSVIADALRAVGRMGRVVLLGSPRGRIEIDPYRDLHSKGVALIGAHNNTTAAAPNAYYPWTQASHRRLALELMRQGRLHTDGLISHRVPASEALPVWDALMTRQQDHLGVIIEWS